MKINYRPEIDGLRAISVFAVIFYHANFILFDYKIFQGGFVGVDIFFVISGYLITSLILKELFNTKNFSFSNFYERRIRRIIPVLFIVILSCIPFAYFSLLPSSLLSFLKSIVYTLFFVSNFYFFHAGQIYGAEDGLLKPLLHTWSLSVEEQFYILFPIFLFLIYKFFSKYLLSIIFFVFILSFITTQIVSSYFPLYNFYFLNVRIWELFAGSIIAYLELNNKNSKSNNYNNFYKYFPFIGIVIIFFSIFTLNDQMSLPSFYTFPVILGTCLIIYFSNKQNIIIKILSNKIIVFFGLISYSLYLWHHPVFAFYRYNFPSVENSSYKFLIILAVFFLSIISYFFIEKPFRNKNIINRKKLIFLLFFQFFLICFLTTSIIYKGQNSTDLIYDKINIDNEVYKQKVELEGPLEYPLNTFNSPRKNVLIFGNSHAIDFYLLFRTNPNLFTDYSFRFSSIKSLLNYLNSKNSTFQEEVGDYNCKLPKTSACTWTIKYSESDLFNKTDIILFSNHWSKSDLKILESLIAELVKRDKKIILTTQNVNIPTIGIKEVSLFDKFITDNKRTPNDKELSVLEKEYFDFMINDTKKNRFNNRLTEIYNKYNIKLLDKSAYQCDYKSKSCKILTPEGYKINYSKHHHTLEGLKHLGNKIYKLKWLDID